MIDSAIIDVILADIDIEGLLAMGTPRDEYAGEARAIAERAGRITLFTNQAIAELIEVVWNENFGPLSEADLAKRRAAFAEAARRIAAAARF